MTKGSCIFLMYHELALPGRMPCRSEPGYVRYVITNREFREQMQWIKDCGHRGLSVSEALKFPGRGVCITFDDGCETDLVVAAPLLQELSFGATFYLTAGFLGTPGYLSADQARELDARGFEIGCHSMTHSYLPDLSDAELKREIVHAKQRIEEILGHSIAHFSAPGGRYDTRALELAGSAGFRTFATSEFHVNSSTTDPYKLGRVAILRGMPLAEFSAICEGQGLWKKRLNARLRDGFRKILGNQAYDQLRAALLRQPK